MKKKQKSVLFMKHHVHVNNHTYTQYIHTKQTSHMLRILFSIYK